MPPDIPSEQLQTWRVQVMTGFRSETSKNTHHFASRRLAPHQGIGHPLPQTRGLSCTNAFLRRIQGIGQDHHTSAPPGAPPGHLKGRWFRDSQPLIPSNQWLTGGRQEKGRVKLGETTSSKNGRSTFAIPHSFEMIPSSCNFTHSDFFASEIMMI